MWPNNYFKCISSIHVQYLCVVFFSQTITRVLLQYCTLLAKSFPSYCEKEKIVSILQRHRFIPSSLCAQHQFREQLSALKAPYTVEWTNISAAAALLSSSWCSIMGSFLLFLPPAALRSDEQHPADEGAVGKDVWVDGSKTGEYQQVLFIFIFPPPSLVESRKSVMVNTQCRCIYTRGKACLKQYLLQMRVSNEPPGRGCQLIIKGMKFRSDLPELYDNKRCMYNTM